MSMYNNIAIFVMICNLFYLNPCITINFDFFIKLPDNGRRNCYIKNKATNQNCHLINEWTFHFSDQLIASGTRYGQSSNRRINQQCCACTWMAQRPKLYLFAITSRSTTTTSRFTKKFIQSHVLLSCYCA